MRYLSALLITIFANGCFFFPSWGSFGDDDWVEYEEPVLVSRVRSRQALLIVRVVAAVWAIAVVIAAASKHRRTCGVSRKGV